MVPGVHGNEGKGQKVGGKGKERPLVHRPHDPRKHEAGTLFVAVDGDAVVLIHVEVHKTAFIEIQPGDVEVAGQLGKGTLEEGGRYA